MSIRTNVVFLYSDSLKRDFSTCYILKEKLKKSGIKSIICSRRNLNKFLKLVVPKKLFLIGQIDIIPQKIIKYSNRGKSEIYFMPSEGYTAERIYNATYPNNNIYNHISSIYFWGPNPFNWFKKNRKIDDLKKLKNIGCVKIPIAKAYSENKNPSNKIGFIGRFCSFNDLYQRSLMEFFSYESTNAEIDQLTARVRVETESLSFYLKAFQNIFENSNFTISYRPHPNENLNEYRFFLKKYKDRFELNYDYDVADWFSKCSKVVGLASTSFVDASIIGTPIISIDNLVKTSTQTSIYNPGLTPLYFSSYNPENLNDFFELLNKENLKPIKSKNFNDFLKKNYKGRSYIVFDEIINDLKNGLKTSILFDFIIITLLFTIDFILFFYHRLFNKNRLQFDYSLFFHRKTEGLKYIEKKINNSF